MSDDLKPPTDPPPPGEHEHHGVVETLREELHEVVEHVPQPVRWTVGKLVRVAVFVFLALVVVAAISAVLYLANRTELVAREITLVLNQTLAQRSDVVLDVPDIKGNPFTGFTAVSPSVRFRDGTPLLDAKGMRVGYSLWGLLSGGSRPITIELDRPIIRLDQGAKGAWRFPEWKAAASLPGTKPRALAFDVRMHEATLVAPRPLGRFEGVELALSGNTGAAMRLDLKDLHWRSGPWHSRMERLSAEFSTASDSARFRVRTLHSKDLTLSAVGGWRTGGSERRVHIDLAHVRWEWLAEVFDNKTFAVPGKGAATIDALGEKKWSGRFRTVVSWDSLDATGSSRFSWDGTQLALDSLDGHSLAGNLRGDLRWTRKGWEIGGLADGADPAHWHALHLVGWPAGKMNGYFRYKVETHPNNMNNSHLVARLAGSEWAGWNVDSARVRIEFPPVAADSFQVVGFRRGGEFTLDGRVLPGSWSGPYTIRNLPLEEWPDGRATGLRGMLVRADGRVENRAGALFVTGELEGSGTTWSAAQFARWQMHDVKGRLLPTPDLVARANTEDGFFVGVHLDSAEADIHLGDQRVEFAPLRAAAGDTLFTLVGDADWDRTQHWRMTNTYASATSDQFAWTAEPPLVISGDRDGTVFDRVIANDQGGHLEARGRWAAPGGFYDFDMQARGLDMGRVGMPLDWGISGTGDAQLRITGRSGDPRWTFDGRAARPAFAEHRADSVSVSLAGQMHKLEVRDFLYVLDGGRARGAGRVEQTVRPWPDSLTATAVVRWLQDAGAWQGRLDAQRLPVDHLGSLSPQAAGWGGRLDGTLELGGSPPAPTFEVKGSADDFGWRDYRAGRIDLRANYRNGVLDVPETRVTMQDVVSTISGHMPVVLALGRNPVVPDEAMAWSVDVPRGDLRLLPALVPLIQSSRGRFDLTAKIAGTTKHPRIVGSGHIRDGTMRPAGREEVVEGVNADLHFDETRITLDTLSAKQGRTGRITSKGEVAMNGFELKGYRFDLAMRDFASSQQGLYALLFDGDFEVIDGPRVHGVPLPQVLGDMRIKRGSVEFDFANQSEVQKRVAMTEPLYWTYHIHMEAPSNLRWRPPDGDIEFNADLDLEQTADSLLIYGEMHAIRGHYFFLSNRFKVTTADLTFDNQKGVDPIMDLTAETSLIPTRSELWASSGDFNRRRAETITAHITGRASQPVISMDGPEGWDQREILGELTYGRFVNGGSLTADPLQNYLTRQLTNQLSRDLSKFFNDAINQWEVQREQGELLNGQGGLVVTIGGDLNPQLSWKYSQRLPGSERSSSLASGTSLFERDVEVEYRLNRFIYVTSELTQPRTSTGLTSPGTAKPDFNINLKARWEY